jgi:hypothetical protein
MNSGSYPPIYRADLTLFTLLDPFYFAPPRRSLIHLLASYQDCLFLSLFGKSWNFVQPAEITQKLALVGKDQGPAAQGTRRYFPLFSRITTELSRRRDLPRVTY